MNLLAALFSGVIQAQGQVGSKNSMMASSPFTDYTAGVVMYVIVIGLLVATLLIGGILIVNLAMMSKREEDRVGGRTPSDVGILKDTIWPNEREPSAILPAEDEGQGGEGIAASLSSRQPPSHNVNTHIDLEAERRKREALLQREAEIQAETQENKIRRKA